MKRIILSLTIALIAIAAASYWWLTNRSYEAAPVWTVSNESNLTVISHEDWQEILDEYLISDDPSGVNLFDYRALQEDGVEPLSAYISSLTEMDPRGFRRDQQFAYWVNLYNALTIELMVKNYPLDSIKEVSQKTLAVGPWDDVLTKIAGVDVTLNDIEHRILRPIWQDHRIHFAVNCASIGCPNVQAMAFTVENTEELLDAAARDFVNHPRGLSIDGNQLTLSSIFNWYQGDFGSNESEMLETISSYLSAEKRSELKSFNGSTNYQYDWSLNDYQ